MEAFLAAAVAFPTIIFTVMVVAFVLYGIAVLVGATDVEWLDNLLEIDDSSDGPFDGFLGILGIAGVPLSIFGGVAAVFAWITSIFAHRFVSGSTLGGVLIALGAAVAGLLGGALALRPLRKIFNTPKARSNRDVVGRICTVRSLSVSENGGTAEVEDGGSGFIAEVRCFRENKLTIGSKAVVYDYDPKAGVYHVGPADPAIVQTEEV